MFKRLISHVLVILIFAGLISTSHGAYDPSDPRHEFISTVRKNFHSEITERQKLLGTKYNSVALIDIARERMEMGVQPASEPDWSQVIHAVSLGWGYARGLVYDPTITEIERNVMKRGYSFKAIKQASKEEAYFVEPSHIFSRESHDVIENYAYGLNRITRDICLNNRDIPKEMSFSDRAKKIIPHFDCPLTPAQSSVMAKEFQRRVDAAVAIGMHMFLSRERAQIAQESQHFRMTPHGMMRPTFAPLPAPPPIPGSSGFSFRMTSIMDMPGFGGYSSSHTVPVGGYSTVGGAGASAPTFRSTGTSAARDLYRSICAGIASRMDLFSMETAMFAAGMGGLGVAAAKLAADSAKTSAKFPDPEDDDPKSDRLKKKLKELQSAQEKAVKTERLPDGRIRYYNKERPATNPGLTRGASRVVEHNPRTGNIRSWEESYNHKGEVIRVHPETINGQNIQSTHYPLTGKEMAELLK